jgi:hypothetical protein
MPLLVFQLALGVGLLDLKISLFLSLMTMICVQVISLLKDDSCFIQELFARMRLSNISMESKRELVSTHSTILFMMSLT